MTEPILTEAERKRVMRHMPALTPGYVLIGLLEDVRAILAARLAPVEAEREALLSVHDVNKTLLSTMSRADRERRSAEQERDEARANRDRLAHEVAALRRQVADLRETEAVLRGEIRRSENAIAKVDEIIADRDEHAARTFGAQKANEILRERLTARDETIARVRTLAEQWQQDYPGSLASCWRAPDEWWRELRAALDRPAPQPDEGCPNHCREGVVECWSPGGPCEQPNRPGCETCGTCNHCTPPTTDAEEA